MGERKPDQRTGDRRKGDDTGYQGEERRQSERRAPDASEGKPPP